MEISYTKHDFISSDKMPLTPDDLIPGMRGIFVSNSYLAFCIRSDYSFRALFFIRYRNFKQSQFQVVEGHLLDEIVLQLARRCERQLLDETVVARALEG